MPERGPLLTAAGLPAWIFRSNPFLHWRSGAIITALSLVILFVWTVDETTLNNLVDWSNRRDLSPVKVAATSPPPPPSPPPPVSYSADHFETPAVSPTPLILETVNPSLIENSSHFTPPESQQISPEEAKPYIETAPSPRLAKPSWILAELELNYTSNLLTQWTRPGGEQCKDSRTVEIKIPKLDGTNTIPKFVTGEIHEVFFQALDESGNARCLGGDYFETDLSSESWKSRPPVTDFNNGTYSIKLQVHPDFAADFNLTIILLFRHFEGLKFSPTRFVFDKQLRQMPVKFVKSDAALPDLETCTISDFNRSVWSGRWTRHAKNDKCGISEDGRYRCYKPDQPCVNPWCNGALGLLESNGWVYSSHCSYRLFTSESAWNCLSNRWIFFWGDSNHVDSVRNLLFFILQVSKLEVVTRRFDMNFTNPRNPAQSIRITSVFNGHWDDSHNYLGIESLRNEGFRDLLKGYFAGETIPDTMIMNSGLHDGVYWPNIKRFAIGAEYTAKFWAEVIDSVKKRGLKPPRFVYRTTVATGGYARSLAFNPNKMEAMNLILLEKLRNAGVISSVIDGFDLTFPWHYDNRCNDGVHYGRAPAKLKWKDGEIGHQYFVDVMLIHIWLNVLCPREQVNVAVA